MVVTLDAAHPDEHELIYCNFAALIGTDDDIATVNPTAIIDKAGADATPSGRVYGAAVLFPPRLVGQWVDGLVAGADYRLTFDVTTSGGRRLKAYCVLPVREP